MSWKYDSILQWMSCSRRLKMSGRQDLFNKGVSKLPQSFMVQHQMGLGVLIVPASFCTMQLLIDARYVPDDGAPGSKWIQELLKNTV